MTRVKFDADCSGKMASKSPVAARRLKHPPAIAHQRTHGVDHRGWREYLAEKGYVVSSACRGNSL
jgi:hypothetical protein